MSMHSHLRLAVAAAGLATSVSAAAATPVTAPSVPRLGSGRALAPAELLRRDDTYRIGDEWGKRPVTDRDLESPTFARAARATARVGGATGFYLGEFAGKHVIATNHHVCPSASSCVGSTATFPLLNVSARMIEHLGTWSDVDLSLLVIDVRSDEDAAKLAAVAGNFAFDHHPSAGEPLLTIGFGIGDNPRRQMMANQDADCKVFSQTDDIRFMADPDALNPADYSAWSFANGCDVSHGDSGSAMVDRETGDVVGIIWTGRIPKPEEVQHSDFLDQLFADNGAEIWTDLSYAVPAYKMVDYLRTASQDEATSESTRAILAAIIE
jgi:hypothetical protein